MKVRCPKCREPLRIKDEAAGKKVRCPNCQAVLAVPAPSPPAQPEAPSPLGAAPPSSGAGPARVTPLVYIRCLFGGVWSQVGWAVLGIGLIFVWTHVLSADIEGWLYFSGELETVQGCVPRPGGKAAAHDEFVRPEQRDEPLYDETHRHVQKVEYEYEGRDGKTYVGTDKLVGTHLIATDRVQVEFPTGKPTQSRIKTIIDFPEGDVRKPHVIPAPRGKRPPQAALMGLVPIAGVLMIFAGRRRGQCELARIKTGEMPIPESGVLLAAAALILPALTIVGHGIYAIGYFVG